MPVDPELEILRGLLIEQERRFGYSQESARSSLRAQDRKDERGFTPKSGEKYIYKTVRHNKYKGTVESFNVSIKGVYLGTFSTLEEAVEKRDFVLADMAMDEAYLAEKRLEQQLASLKARFGSVEKLRLNNIGELEKIEDSINITGLPDFE